MFRAVGKQVLQVRYASPWSADGGVRIHDLEPWQLRLHDGNMYMRAYSRTYNEARIFRVAQIEGAEPIEGLTPREPIPPPDKIWGDEDPAFGIDHDRPGTAVLRIRAPMARWIHRIVWDPGQRDEWIEDGELLERRVAYR